MALFARFSSSSISTGRTFYSAPIILNGALISLPVSLSSTTSTVTATPSEPAIGENPEFTANGALIMLPVSLSSTASTVSPSAPGIGENPEFTANGALITLPVRLSN